MILKSSKDKIFRKRDVMCYAHCGLFIILKLTGLVNWSWWLVFAPIWIWIPVWIITVLTLVLYQLYKNSQNDNK